MVITLTCCIGPHVAHAAPLQLVFDNTSGSPGSFFGPGCCALGDEIALSGDARRLQQLSVLVDNQNVDMIATFSMSIYLNDGLDGAPGTLLWTGGPTAGVGLPAQEPGGPRSGTQSIVDIAVPRVLVPDTFTLAWAPGSSYPSAYGRFLAGISTVGSLERGWLQTDFDPPPSGWIDGPAFAVRVYAVPEVPPLPLFALAATVGTLAVRRRRWRGGGLSGRQDHGNEDLSRESHRVVRRPDEGRGAR